MEKKTNKAVEYAKAVKATKAVIAEAEARELYNTLVADYNALLADRAKVVKALAAMTLKAEKTAAKLAIAEEKAKAKKSK